MDIPQKLNLPECLLLLAIDDTTGRIESKSGALDFGLAGAAIAELLMTGSLVLDDDKIRTADMSLLNDSILDSTLATINDSKPHDIKHWVRKFGNGRFKGLILDRLVQNGIVRKEEHRILWVIPTDRYPTEDASPERALREAIRSAVMAGGTLQPRTAALISLMSASDLTGMVFDREERKQYKDRISDIANGDMMGAAVGKVVKDAQTAIGAALVATSVAAVTASTS